MSEENNKKIYELSSDDSDEDADDGGKEKKTEEAANLSNAARQPNPINKEYVIYFPTFRDEMMSKATIREEMKQVHDVFLKKNWLTPALCEEIHNAAPKASDIDKSNGQRNTAAFEEACASMFEMMYH